MLKMEGKKRTSKNKKKKEKTFYREILFILGLFAFIYAKFKASRIDSPF